MQNTSRYPSIPKVSAGKEIFYEFPLSGQVRTYLRIEHLLKRLETNASLANDVESELYFQSLFGLCILLTQIHVRSDLIKDLAKQRERFKSWAKNPDIDTVHLDNLCTESYVLQQQLLQAPRLAQNIRDDYFLLSFRQRFEVPAGSCCFDAPHLHYWLSMPEDHLRTHTEQWNKELAPISKALFFWLQIVRNGAQMKNVVIQKGIYHQEAPDAHLVQLKIGTEHNTYPVVNNYKTRFSVRLMPFNDEDAIKEEINVSLAAF